MPPAGPALDAALARLFGWEEIDASLRHPAFNRAAGRFNPSCRQFMVDPAQGVRVAEHRWELWVPSAGGVPNAAPWDVIETLRARWYADDPDEPFYWRFEDCGPSGWRVDIVWDHHDGAIPCVQAGAATLSLAICHAAYRFLKEHEAAR
jgi:hypothetical protein